MVKKKKSKFKHISINKKSFIFMKLSGGIYWETQVMLQQKNLIYETSFNDNNRVCLFKR